MELDQLSTNPSNQMDRWASPTPAQFRIRLFLVPVIEKAAPTKNTGAKTSSSQRLSPPIYLRDKSKWSTVSAGVQQTTHPLH
ncbi:hypothetical protein EVAR_87720_1 [Eumeta japonica]|uniref:Uncharacterized protein n=1 Tax=Eumeta variegata TaxID=151549 RepID=A0A4C1TCG1_EUMVA|nr:hypothetical protein EVAR_87720_1 [Eumeta japonica]